MTLYNAHPETEFCNRPSNHAYFGAHCVSIGLIRSVETVQVRCIDDIIVKQRNLSNTQARQQHGHSAASAATPDHTSAHSPQIAI
jgi:hypothetical protein